jgi:HK97 family phage major capsid protein
MNELEKLRAKLREKHAALVALRTKAFGDDAKQEDVDAFEAALKECEDIETKIGLAERDEAIAAKTAKPADAPTTPAAQPTVSATAKDNKPEEVLAIVAASLVKGKEDNLPALKVMADAGYGRLASELVPHNQKAVNTLVSAEGGILVPQAQVGGILPLLRQQVTFLDAGPTQIELANGQYKVARGASGATAAYVGEGGLKPVSTPTFDAIDMASKKLAGIVPLTEEVTRWAIGNIQNYVQNDLRSALALTMDLNMWIGTGAGTSPLGVFNKANIQTIAAAPFFADAAAPTVEELDRMGDAMVLALISAGLMPAAGRWRWVMSYRTAMWLASLRLGDTSQGDLAYPTMTGAGQNAVTWRGFPVTVTAQVPTNLGVGTNESFIALVDMSHVLFGEEMVINMRWSNQATLDPDGSGENLIHLWQQNMSAVLAESMHDVGLRYSKAVVKATGVLI